MYLVFSDFEGTFKCNKKLTDLELNTLNSFLIANKLIILTDSKIDEVKEYLDLYNLNIDIFSTLEGKYYQNNILKSEDITKDIIEGINNKFKEHIYTAYGEGLNGGYIFNYEERLAPLYPKTNIDLHDLYYYVVAIKIDYKIEFINYLNQNNLNNQIIGEDNKRALIKINNHFINKAEIVKAYKNKYPNTKTIGIGDSLIDFDFINLCDIKVSMKNAPEALKKKTSFTTEYTSDEAGLIKYLNNISKF